MEDASSVQPGRLWVELGCKRDAETDKKKRQELREVGREEEEVLGEMGDGDGARDGRSI